MCADKSFLEDLLLPPQIIKLCFDCPRTSYITDKMTSLQNNLQIFH